MKWHTPLLLVALVGFSLPVQTEGFVWFPAIMALPWASIAVKGAVSVVSGIIAGGIVELAFKDERDQRDQRGRKLMDVPVGEDGKIDWHHNQAAIDADAALHRYIHENLAEIEDHIPDPELKKETLDSSKHSPDEVEHAMVLSLEKYVEEHPQEFSGHHGETIDFVEIHQKNNNASTLNDADDELKVGKSGTSPAVYVGVAVAVAVSAFGGGMLIRKRHSSRTHQDLEAGSETE